LHHRVTPPRDANPAPVTCTVDAPEKAATPRSTTPKGTTPNGPAPPEVSTARDARDPTQLMVLARHEDRRVRAAVARNVASPEAALAALVNDPEGVVLEAVAANPSLSDALFVDILENPRVVRGGNYLEALFQNGPRGAYARATGSMARGLLYALGALFLFSDVVNVLGASFSGTARDRGRVSFMIAGSAGALVALLFARMLRPLCRLDVEGLRARTKRPLVGTWLARIALLALCASQIRACAAI
jgi:hypothetical protein